MQVRVLLFGILKDLAGRHDFFLKLPEGATVAEVLAAAGQDYPQLRDRLPSLACAVNQQFAGRATALQHNDEVALLPPVSGGAPPVSCDCRLVREAIHAAEALKSIRQPEDGALVVFDGIVRNHTRGRRTLYLEYEAYDPMALAQMEQLAEEALAKFAAREVILLHRLGRLEIGETSVLVAVASAHRAPAFDACRWLIDTLKRTVPIWKKEFFEDGAVWAPGEPFPEEISLGDGAGEGSAASK